MSKVFQPEHVVTDNPHGAMVYGPVTTEKDDDGTRYVQTVKGGHTIIVNENGNKLDHTPGTHNELCGTDLVKGKNTDAPDEAVAKAIVARKGDIVIVAEHGNIKLKANNIYVESSAPGNSGNFLVEANGHIGMTAGEKVTIGGAKFCMISTDNITLSAKGDIIQICEQLQKSTPLSNIFGIFTNLSLASMLKLLDKECGNQTDIL